MAADPSADVQAPATGPRDKVRLIFRKDGALRWLSHHDLMRTFERMLRRSGLPFRSTQGFNPHPRIVFALALPVGVVGCAEVAELELDAILPLDEIQARLERECPLGLTILSIERISPRVTAHVTGFTYAIAIPTDRREAVQARILDALAQTSWRVERMKPAPRVVDIRPFIRALRLNEQSGQLEMDLWLTSAGTARPEEVLGLMEQTDLLEMGFAFERLRLHLDDQDPLTTPGSE